MPLIVEQENQHRWNGPVLSWTTRFTTTSRFVVQPAVTKATTTYAALRPSSTARAARCVLTRSAEKRNLPSSVRSSPRPSDGWTCGRRTYCAGLAVIRPSMCARIGRNRTRSTVVGPLLMQRDRVVPCDVDKARYAAVSLRARQRLLGLPIRRTTSNRAGTRPMCDCCSGLETRSRQVRHRQPVGRRGSGVGRCFCCWCLSVLL